MAATAVCAGSLTPLLADAAAAAVPPAAPAVVAPLTAGAGLKEVVLDWAPVAGATSYAVEVDTDGEWSDDPTLTLKTVASRITLPTSLPHASYVWRVAAVGSGGQSDWSEAGSFTRGWSERARPLGPVGTTSPAPGVVTFRWSPVPTASEYQLQVSNSPYFDAAFSTQADVKTESCFTTRTSITPFNSQTDGRNDGAGDCEFTLLGTGEPRWWRVRPLDHVADDAPELNTTPVVDEGISSLPPAKAGELDTSACPEPVKASPSSTPASPTPSATTSPSPSGTASPTASPSGTPAARPTSAPESKGGCEPAHTVEKGAWSAGTGFTDTRPRPTGPVPAYRDLVTAARPMPTPTLSQDVCSGTLCRDFPTISWGKVDGAHAYRLYVALDADYTNIQAIAETPGNSWTPPDQWRDSTAGTPYYVVVQPCTTTAAADGSRAGCDEPSAPVVFRKSSPKLAQSAPAHGALVGGSEVVLSWQAASSALSAATRSPATSEAHAYRIQVTRSTNPGFSKAGLIEDVIVDSTHHVSADKRYADGAHLWRVQPIDASGHRLPWSTTRSFTRDGTAPTVTLRPAALPARGPFAVRFSEPVTGVGPTSVVLSGATVKLAGAADRRSITVTPTRPLLPGASHTLTIASSVRDRAGNGASPARMTVTVDPTVDDRSSALALSGTWKRFSASNAVARTFTRSVPTTRKPTAATVALTGRGVEVKGCVGPQNGKLDVIVDGVRVKQVDSYRSYSGCGVVLAKAAFEVAGGVHRIQVRGTGLKNPRSKGTAVAVDAITALR